MGNEAQEAQLKPQMDALVERVRTHGVDAEAIRMAKGIVGSGAGDDLRNLFAIAPDLFVGTKNEQTGRTSYALDSELNMDPKIKDNFVSVDELTAGVLALAVRGPQGNRFAVRDTQGNGGLNDDYVRSAQNILPKLCGCEVTR